MGTPFSNKPRYYWLYWLVASTCPVNMRQSSFIIIPLQTLWTSSIKQEKHFETTKQISNEQWFNDQIKAKNTSLLWESGLTPSLPGSSTGELLENGDATLLTSPSADTVHPSMDLTMGGTSKPGGGCRTAKSEILLAMGPTQKKSITYHQNRYPVTSCQFPIIAGGFIHTNFWKKEEHFSHRLSKNLRNACSRTPAGSSSSEATASGRWHHLDSAPGGILCDFWGAKMLKDLHCFR